MYSRAIVPLALCCLIAPASAQSNRQELLNNIPRSQSAKSQSDLDTMQLASAHRERAESMQERTNGLWQSWLVSVCEGCGPPTPPYKKTVSEDLAKNVSVFGPKVAQSNRDPVVARKNTAPGEYSRLIYEDLSTENIDQIRRMPK